MVSEFFIVNCISLIYMKKFPREVVVIVIIVANDSCLLFQDDFVSLREMAIYERVKRDIKENQLSNVRKLSI